MLIWVQRKKETRMSLGTVLVLEDSRVQAQLISRMLSNLDWSSVLSFDHKMVFSQLKTLHVDLMLLDVYVEDGNTLSRLPEIRALAPDVPIAIMTGGGAGGYALNQTLNAARRAEADPAEACAGRRRLPCGPQAGDHGPG